MHRSYSRKGHRPVLIAPLVGQACLRAAVAISSEGDLFYEVRECTFNSPAMVRFVKNVRRAWRKKLLLIWDGASTHTSDVVKKWLSTQTETPEVWLSRIPPYSPELNPAEQVWNYMKNVLLKNICCKTVKELKIKVIEAFEVIKKDKALIQTFFCHKAVAFYD